MGPLSESHVNNYILIVGVLFSKWHESADLPNHDAKTVARAFVEHWVVRFGCADNRNKDQGSNPISKFFRCLSSQLGIQSSSTISS